MRHLVRIVPATAFAAAIALAPRLAEAQCAMCRTALDSPEAKRLIEALLSGTVLLLVVPAAAVATVAWVALRDRRRLLSELDDDDR